MGIRSIALTILTACLAAGVPTPVLGQAENGDAAEVAVTDETWSAAMRRWSLVVAQRAQIAYIGTLVPMGIEGRVVVEFQIGAEGLVRDCNVVASSGYSELDALVCTAIDRTGPAPPYVNIDDDGEVKTAQLPVRFVLVDGLDDGD